MSHKKSTQELKFFPPHYKEGRKLYYDPQESAYVQLTDGEFTVMQSISPFPLQCVDGMEFHEAEAAKFFNRIHFPLDNLPL